MKKTKSQISNKDADEFLNKVAPDNIFRGEITINLDTCFFAVSSNGDVTTVLPKNTENLEAKMSFFKRYLKDEGFVNHPDLIGSNIDVEVEE